MFAHLIPVAFAFIVTLFDVAPNAQNLSNPSTDPCAGALQPAVSTQPTDR